MFFRERKKASAEPFSFFEMGEVEILRTEKKSLCTENKNFRTENKILSPEVFVLCRGA